MTASSQGTLLTVYRVYYISGLSDKPHLIRNVKMHVFSEGFFLSGKLFAPLWIPYTSIYDFKLSAGIGSPWTHASRSGAFLEKLIEIEFCDQNQQKVFLTLEMVVSIFSGLPNYRACKKLLEIVTLSGAFDKFIPTAVASSSPNIMDQIERLAELHKSDALTDMEFQSKKEELLKRL